MNLHCLVIIVASAFGGMAWCVQENPASSGPLRQDKNWSCVSALQESQLVFYDTRKHPRTDQDSEVVDWRLVKGTRVIARGRASHSRNNNRDEYTVRLDLSDVKIRSVVEVELQLITKNTKTLKTLYLFPGSPFVEQQTLLTEAKVHLFDPAGDTKTVFESAQIPFKSIPRLESFGSFRDALIIVGEGLNFDRQAGLIETLSDAAQHNRVILMAPSKGSIEFELTGQNRLILEDEMIVRRMDRRFDVETWAGKSPISFRWEVNQSDTELSLKESDSLAAWPWIEIRGGPVDDLEETQSTFTLCGLGIVSRWNDGPVAQHLLFELLRKNSNQPTVDRKHKPNLAQERTGETNDQ